MVLFKRNLFQIFIKYLAKLYKFHLQSGVICRSHSASKTMISYIVINLKSKFKKDINGPASDTALSQQIRALTESETEN